MHSSVWMLHLAFSDSVLMFVLTEKSQDHHLYDLKKIFISGFCLHDQFDLHRLDSF